MKSLVLGSTPPYNYIDPIPPHGRDLLSCPTYDNTSSPYGACTDTSVEIEGVG